MIGWAKEIKAYTKARVMPPWKAADPPHRDTRKFKTMISISYGVPDPADIVSACNGEDYPMELPPGDDLDVVARAINQGIDSHLEPIRFHEFTASCGHKIGIAIEPESMPVFLRRLVELWEAGDEPAGDFASSILQTLDIDWI
jgi:hypothetical protein